MIMKTALAPDSIHRIIREASRPLEPVPTGATPSTEPLQGIRHISFDVYGTLLVSGVGDIGNSAPADRGAALEGVLRRLGGDTPSKDDLTEMFLATLRDQQSAARRAGALQPEVDIREVWMEFLRTATPTLVPTAEEIEETALRFETDVNPVWPMPGLEQTLAALSPRFAPFSIVSNAQFFTPCFFSALLGRSLDELGFDPGSCVWSFREREAKPSPRLFERLLSRLGGDLRPEHVLYVGNDRLNDVAAARSAGLRTALFAGDKRSLRLREGHPECADAHPDLILTSLDQLPGLV